METAKVQDDALAEKVRCWDHWQICLNSTIPQVTETRVKWPLNTEEDMFVKRNYATIESYRKFDVTSMSLTQKDVLKHSLQIYITPRFQRMNFTTFQEHVSCLVTPATIFHPNMFFLNPQILMDAGFFILILSRHLWLPKKKGNCGPTTRRPCKCVTRFGWWGKVDGSYFSAA